MIWAKYLRIEFLTHYGTEYYCPFSQIKVFGTTMMEEVQEEKATLSSTDSTIPSKVSTLSHEIPMSIMTTATRLNVKISPSLTSDESEPHHLDICNANTTSIFMKEMCCITNVSQKETSSTSDHQHHQSKSTSSRVIQESIFKNIIKRLGALEEHSNLNQKSFDEQQQTLKIVLNRLTIEKQESFQGILKQDKMDSNVFESKDRNIESILLDILSNNNQMKKRLDDLEKSISQLKEEHFLYQWISQILFVLLILFGKHVLYTLFKVKKKQDQGQSQEQQQVKKKEVQHIQQKKTPMQDLKIQKSYSGLLTPIEYFYFKLHFIHL